MDQLPGIFYEFPRKSTEKVSEFIWKQEKKEGSKTNLKEEILKSCFNWLFLEFSSVINVNKQEKCVKN